MLLCIVLTCAKWNCVYIHYGFVLLFYLKGRWTVGNLQLCMVI